VPAFFGFDHIDCRVRSLAAVEAFYDELMPEIGLPDKQYLYVDPAGEWHEDADTNNAIGYYEEPYSGKRARFFNIVESPLHRNNETRIAFRVEHSRLQELVVLLQRIGAENVDTSDMDSGYPAVYFEDPAGTKLELLGRGD
jgi:catechol 2,3-dioxygenase-like lactoylglutathione lyase family enzyme